MELVDMLVLGTNASRVQVRVLSLRMQSFGGIAKSGKARDFGFRMQRFESSYPHMICLFSGPSFFFVVFYFVFNVMYFM